MITTQAFAGSIASNLGLGREFGWIVQVGRLPLVVFFVAVAVELVYWIAPNRWTRPRLASPGALFFAVGWAAFTVGFAYYVSNFGSYNATYGAIAGVVIMLLWFQVSSLLILIGAEINSVLEARKIAAAALPPVSPPQARAFAGTPATERAAPVVEFAVLAGVFIALVAWLRARPSG
jgi:membrane protein